MTFFWHHLFEFIFIIFIINGTALCSLLELLMVTKLLSFLFPLSRSQYLAFPVCIMMCSTSQGRIQDFGKGGGAWDVGDTLAVRSSQVCAPGGSEGMPPRTFWNFRCIFLQFGACFIPKIKQQGQVINYFSCYLVILVYSVDERGRRAPPTPPPRIRAWESYGIPS